METSKSSVPAEHNLNHLTKHQRHFYERFKNGAWAWHVNGMTSMCMSDDGFVRPSIVDKLRSLKMVRWDHANHHLVYAAPGEVDRLAETEQNERQRQEQERQAARQRDETYWTNVIKNAHVLENEEIRMILLRLERYGLPFRLPDYSVNASGLTRRISVPV